MKVFEISISTEEQSEYNGGYLSIHDPGIGANRLLYIEDDRGNMVQLHNEQIGELYKAIKPSLAG